MPKVPLSNAPRPFQPPEPRSWRETPCPDRPAPKQAALLSILPVDHALGADAEIVALCRTGMLALERNFAPQPVIDLFIESLRRVASMPAKTSVGLMAKAELLREFLDDPAMNVVVLPPRHTAPGACVISLLNDILGRN